MLFLLFFSHSKLWQWLGLFMLLLCGSYHIVILQILSEMPPYFFILFFFSSPTAVISLSFETSSLFLDAVPKVTGTFFNFICSFLFLIRKLLFPFVKQLPIFAILDCSSTVKTYLSFQLLPRLPKPVMFNKWALSSLAIHGLNHSSRERVLLPLESTLIHLQILIYVHQVPTLSHFLHCLKHLAGILSVWPPLVIRRARGSFLDALQKTGSCYTTFCVHFLYVLVGQQYWVCHWRWSESWGKPWKLCFLSP